MIREGAIGNLIHAIRWNDMPKKEALELAIKALEHPEQNVIAVVPCGDAISRQEAVEAFQMFREYESNRSNKGWVNRIETVLNQLPPVNPQTKWIPVSERLPKIADVYIVTRYYPNNVMNPNYLVDACFFDGSNTWYNDNRINHERDYVNNVIAWQENPEPYEPQKRSDKE